VQWEENIAKIRPTCRNRYVSSKQIIAFIGKPLNTYDKLHFEGKIPIVLTQQVGL
jgi:hypothetical protein